MITIFPSFARGPLQNTTPGPLTASIHKRETHQGSTFFARRTSERGNVILNGALAQTPGANI